VNLARLPSRVAHMQSQAYVRVGRELMCPVFGGVALLDFRRLAG
jgi:hypothetical protein